MAAVQRAVAMSLPRAYQTATANYGEFINGKLD
jgi:hypothetical protein